MWRKGAEGGLSNIVRLLLEAAGRVNSVAEYLSVVLVADIYHT